MSEWGYGSRELHFEEENYFVAWINYEGKDDDLKKIRAFCFLENIDLPKSDDHLIGKLISSKQNYRYLSFSSYMHLSIDEWNLVKVETAKVEWENFALIDIDVLKSKKDYLRRTLGPSIERRAKRHQFFLTWGFKRPY